MASGFILANQRGIAVSMDTMETTPQGEEYHGINRIFPLGNQHKVIIVSSGMDNFMAFPIEILIQRFSHELGPKPLANLTDYTVAFCNFLNSPAANLNSEWYIQDTVLFTLNNIYSMYQQLLNRYSNQMPFEKIFDQAVSQVEGQYQVQKQNISISKLTKKEVIDEFSETVGNMINSWLESLSNYGVNTAVGSFAANLQQPSQLSPQPRSIFSNEYQRIFDIIYNILTHQMRPDYASLIFAGMGADECFGQLQYMDVFGFLDEALYHLDEPLVIDQMHPQIINNVSTYTTQSAGAELLQSGMARIAKYQIQRILDSNNLNNEDKRRVMDAINGAMYSHNQGIQEVVNKLSTDELAKMSRTMVEANSFVSRFLIRSAGVGGEIETITVTYQNGPVWVHRQQKGLS